MGSDSRIDNNRRIAKNTLYLFFRMLVVLAISLYTSRVVLATLGIEDYGLYNVVGGVVVLFTFLQQALNNASYRFLTFAIGEGNGEKLKRVFSMSLNAHLILTAIIIVLSETLGLWFVNSRLVIPESRMYAANWAYQMSVFCCCLNIIKTPYNSTIIAHEKMSFYAYTSIVEVVLKLIIVYLLVVSDFDKLITYSVLLAAVSFLMLIWYRHHCKSHFSETHYHRCWDAQLIGQMVSYSGLSIIVNLADVGVNQSAVFFFNIFYGLATNAALGIANQVNVQLTNFLGTFTQSYSPQIIKSYASGDRQYFMKLIFSSSKFSYYLLFLISIPILLNIDFILDIWLKETPPGTDTFFFMIVCYSLIDAYSAPLWTGVHATGNLKTHQILMASIKIMNIPLAYVLIKMGLPAWCVLALKAFLNIVCSIVRPCYVRHLYDLPLKKYFREIIGSVYATTLIIIPIPMIISTHMEDSWLKLVITSLTFYIISLPTIYFGGTNRQEKSFIQDAIRNKIASLNK